MAKQENIKTRTFEIPKTLIGQFFTQLEEAELDYQLIEVNSDDDELEIEISYTSSQKEQVMDLIELIDDYFSENAICFYKRLIVFFICCNLYIMLNNLTNYFVEYFFLI